MRAHPRQNNLRRVEQMPVWSFAWSKACSSERRYLLAPFAGSLPINSPFASSLEEHISNLRTNRQSKSHITRHSPVPPQLAPHFLPVARLQRQPGDGKLNRPGPSRGWLRSQVHRQGANRPNPGFPPSAILRRCARAASTRLRRHGRQSNA